MNFGNTFIILILIIIVVLTLQLIRFGQTSSSKGRAQQEGFRFGIKPPQFNKPPFKPPQFNIPPFTPPKFPSFTELMKQYTKAFVIPSAVLFKLPPPPPPTPCKDSITSKFMTSIPKGEEKVDGDYRNALLSLLYWFINPNDKRGLRANWVSTDKNACIILDSYFSVLTDANKYNVKNYADLKKLKTAFSSAYNSSTESINVSIDEVFNAFNTLSIPITVIYDKNTETGVTDLTNVVQSLGFKNLSSAFYPKNATDASILQTIIKDINGININEVGTYLFVIRKLNGDNYPQNDFGKLYVETLHPKLSQMLNFIGLTEIYETLNYLCYVINWISKDTFPNMLDKHLKYMKCWGVKDIVAYKQFTDTINRITGIDDDFCKTKEAFVEYWKKSALSPEEYNKTPIADSAIDYNKYQNFIKDLNQNGYKFKKGQNAASWLNGLNTIGIQNNQLMSDAKNLKSTHRTFNNATESFDAMHSNGLFAQLNRTFRKIFGLKEGATDKTDKTAVGGYDQKTINRFLNSSLPIFPKFSYYHDGVVQLFLWRGLENYAGPLTNTNTIWNNMIEVIKALNECGVGIDGFVELQTSRSKLNKKVVKFPDDSHYYLDNSVIRSNIPDNMKTSDVKLIESPANINSAGFGDSVKVQFRTGASGEVINMETWRIGIPWQPKIDSKTNRSQSVIGSPFIKLMDSFKGSQSQVQDWIDILKSVKTYGISNFQDLKDFINSLASFKVYYGQNYESFMEQLSIFGLNNYTNNKAIYNTFLNDMKSFNYNYWDNKELITNIIAFLVQVGYKISSYAGLPHLLLPALKIYSQKNGSKYPNMLSDVTTTVNIAKLREITKDASLNEIKFAMNQAYLIASKQDSATINGKTVNSIMSNNVYNMLSFIFKSEYEILKKSDGFPMDKRVEFIQDIGNSFYKLALTTTNLNDSKEFRRMSTTLILFPHLCFEYIQLRISTSNGAYDDYMVTPNQRTDRTNNRTKTIA